MRPEVNIAFPVNKQSTVCYLSWSTERVARVKWTVDCGLWTVATVGEKHVGDGRHRWKLKINLKRREKYEKRLRDVSI